MDIRCVCRGRKERSHKFVRCTWVARLEEAGIAVEIDAGMLTPHHRKMTLPEVNPTPEPTQHSERATTAHARLLGLASSIKAARENSHRTRGPARTYVQKSGTIFV